jgi:hypothetical protein
MCNECKDNKFEPISSGCSIKFAMRYIEKNLIGKREIDFLNKWVAGEEFYLKNTIRIYQYVFEKYYPLVYKKYKVYQLLK